MKGVSLKSNLSIQSKDEIVYILFTFDITSNASLLEIKSIIENALKETTEFKALILSNFDISYTMSSEKASIVINLEISYNQNRSLSIDFLRAMYRSTLISLIDMLHLHFQLNPKNTKVEAIENTSSCGIVLHEEGVYSYVSA